jgi:phosphomannomutase
LFPDLPLEIAIGGQISIDIYPTGLNKTRCLQYIENMYDEIHFIGDKTMEGGNDYEIYNDKRVIGHTTTDPIYTENIIYQSFR